MTALKVKSVRSKTFMALAVGLPLLTSHLKPLLAVEVTPVYDIRFFGGQHFFDGDVSAVSGNMNVMISPAMSFNDRWSLIPTYMGSYQGTRDVQELAGGGTLFQDSTNHGLTVKGVYAATSALKLKAAAGARTELLRETKDEDWGDGLFDYRKFSGGVEGEYNVNKDMGARLAYDYYALDFPNYKSLESSQDPTLSRELAGEDVLNSGNQLITLGGWTPLPGGVRWDLSSYYNFRDFSDQPVVAASGDLTPTDRADTVMAVTTNFAYPLSLGQNLRLVGELGFGYNAMDSNQNHYDAKKTAFLKDYYDYSQTSVSPRVSAALGGRPWIVSLGATYSRRTYDDRPIQDENGNYLTEDTVLTNIDASLGLTYPLSKNFKARAVGTLGWSDSNMKYEKIFKYNYRIANYLFGFSYEY